MKFILEEMKRGVLFCALLIGLMTVACNTSKNGGEPVSLQNDVEKMGYHGSVKGVKIEEFVPDTRAGQGLTLGKTATLAFDNEGRLLSSVGLGEVNKTCFYGENGKVREIVELYHGIKMHAFHSYDNRGNCIKIDLYKVHRGDSALVEERVMKYNDKDSIISYHARPKSGEMIQTSIFYEYDKNDCFVEKRIYSALVSEKLDLEGDPITRIRAKFDDLRRPVEVDKFSLVEELYTKQIEYNDYGHIVKEVLLKPEAAPQEFTYHYTYGDNGNKIEAYTLRDGVRVEQVKYNDAGKPTLIEVLNEEGQITAQYVYEYDDHGNTIVSVSSRLDIGKGGLVEVYKEVKTIDYYE